jgi:RNA polymerase sigma-70 factor (ECF subfamily)
MELSTRLSLINPDGTLIGMRVLENSSDDELLRLVHNGDEDAFVFLYRRFHAGIYRFVLQMCGSPALADDVTQEVFLVLIRGTESFDPARGSLNAFLYGVARNQILYRLRRERFYVPLEADAPVLGYSTSKPLEELTRTEMVNSVRRAILSLPERYREVVILCELEELSYMESAQILGCAVATVRSRLHRARSLLLEKMQPQKKENIAAEVKTARCFA